jgi:hypothetical protein
MDNIFQNWPQFRLHPPADDLLQSLQHLREATVIQSRPRHSKKSVDKIILMIASQNYSIPLYSLFHLLAALSASGVKFEDLYRFQNTISKQSVEQLLTHRHLPNFLTRNNNLIEFNDKDGNKWFTLAYSQGPISLCLFDFLIETIGPEWIQKIYISLGKTPSQDQIRTTSNEISKSVYAYLKDRLPTSSVQDRAELFSDYIKSLGNGRLTETNLFELIDDDMILEFWELHKDHENFRLKLYSTCVFSWAKYRHAIAVSDKLTFETIDNFDENGESKISVMDKLSHKNFVEQEKYEQRTTQEDTDAIFPNRCLTADSFDFFFEIQDQTPIQLLEYVGADKLQKIKCLNKKEVKILEPLCQLGNQAHYFIKSEARMSVFSPIQSQLVEKIRKKDSIDYICKNILTIPEQKYLEHLEELEEMAKTCQELALNAASRLCETFHPFGLITLREATEGTHEIQLEEFIKKQNSGAIEIPDSIKTAESKAIQILENLPKALPGLSEIMKENLKKYRRFGLNKTKKQSDDDFLQWRDEIMFTVPILMKLNNFIRMGIKNSSFSRDKIELNQVLADDKKFFFISFSSLYGGKDDQKGI